MILIDTPIWIEFFKGREPHFSSLRQQIEKQNIFSPEPVFGELLQGANDNRERQILMDYWKSLPRHEENGLWIEAGSLSSRHQFISKGVGLIDAFLVAVARKYRFKIWTLDKKLLSILRDEEIYEPTNS